MPIIQVTPVAGSVSVLDLLKNALMEIGVLAQGESLPIQDANFTLGKLNRLLDQWNARKLYVYAYQFFTNTLTPNLQPHTIGPSSATFTVTQRPVKIEHANIILTNSTPNVRVPLNIRDAAWWANLQVQDISTTLPTDLYYSPAWPNGEIFLWPKPTQAFKLELQIWTLLERVVLTDDVLFPPGYEEAITLTLAEKLAPPFGVQPTPQLSVEARKAREIIQSVNSVAPRISSRDWGVPTGGKPQPYFNYLSGSGRGSR